MTSTASVGMRMWKSMQAWSSVRAAASQKSMAEASSALSALQTAWSNKITGSATLISKITQKRLAAEAQAKLNKIA